MRAHADFNLSYFVKKLYPLRPLFIPLPCFLCIGGIIAPIALGGDKAYLYFMSEDFTITARAAERIAIILQQEKAAAACLRVAVQGGGCSGFSYAFSIDTTRTDDDHAFSQDAITVLVDDVSLQYLQGAEIDWVDDLIGAAFRINNPNATAACGCGTSFDVA